MPKTGRTECRPFQKSSSAPLDLSGAAIDSPSSLIPPLTQSHCARALWHNEPEMVWEAFLSSLDGSFCFFPPLWCLWRFSVLNSIGPPPRFRLGLHFSALICIIREGSHWKRSRRSMCGRCWSAARRTMSIPLKVGPDVCHYLYW